MILAMLFGGAEILVLLAALLIFPLAIASFVFWVWMLVHAIQNKGLSDSEKVGWVLAIVFLHFLGGLLYFFIGRPKALSPPGLAQTA